MWLMQRIEDGEQNGSFPLAFIKIALFRLKRHAIVLKELLFTHPPASPPPPAVDSLDGLSLALSWSGTPHPNKLRIYPTR